MIKNSPSQKEIREARGSLTQKEAAALIGKTAVTWARWESTSLNTEICRKMDRAFFDLFLIRKKQGGYDE
jgi:DNA-binding XRE family transcriptional regulator